MLVRPDGSTERFRVEGIIDVGRDDAADVIVPDAAVSRRHLTLDATGSRLMVTDLDSANGTFRNGERVQGSFELAPGDEVVIGDSILRLDPDPKVATEPAVRARPAARVAPISAGDESSTTSAGIEVRWQPGSHGERVSGSYLSAAVHVRRDLADLGSEGLATEVVVHLVDPFADPEHPEELVTSGAIVDGPNHEAWVVVTPEAPPEDPHRVLALLFGAALPCASDVEVLLEGYGLHLAGTDDTESRLRG